MRRFWSDEQGQDTVEYSLLLAFVSVAAAAFLYSMGGDIKSIFSVTSSHLSVAASAATG